MDFLSFILKMLTRNLRCDLKETPELTLQNCPTGIKNLKINKMIGQGSFGYIYSATGIIRGKEKEFVVKRIFNHIVYDLDRLTLEVEYAFLCLIWK